MAGNPSLDEIAAIFEETRRPRVSLIRPGLIHLAPALVGGGGLLGGVGSAAASTEG